jgi:hypothetical protein
MRDHQHVAGFNISCDTCDESRRIEARPEQQFLLDSGLG